MPGQLHESLGEDIKQEILHQLNTIAQSGSPSAIFARDIRSRGSADIIFQDVEYSKHSPDASFQHPKAQYPGVILEVSHSQKKRDLSKLAYEYILGSDADIRVVVGIDVEYKGSKKATISVWRPHIGPNELGEQELSVVHTVADQAYSSHLKRDLFANAASPSVMIPGTWYLIPKQACNCDSKILVRKLLVPDSLI